MTTAKITITIDKKTLARARHEVRKKAAPSLSAYITRAVDEYVADADFHRTVQGWLEETGGPSTKEEIAWAHAALGLKSKAKPRRRRSA